MPYNHKYWLIYCFQLKVHWPVLLLVSCLRRNMQVPTDLFTSRYCRFILKIGLEMLVLIWAACIICFHLTSQMRVIYSYRRGLLPSLDTKIKIVYVKLLRVFLHVFWLSRMPLCISIFITSVFIYRALIFSIVNGSYFSVYIVIAYVHYVKLSWE